jgi:hypothetical protein
LNYFQFFINHKISQMYTSYYTCLAENARSTSQIMDQHS